MPFTLAQLEFVGVHLGLAVAPDFIENKRCAEKYTQLRAQFDSEHPDLKDHHQAQAIGAALLECDELAKAGNKFAAALESLARARDLVEMPPPVEPQPPAPVVPPELNVVADAPVSANVEKEVPSDVAPPPLENPPVQDAPPPVGQPAPVQPPVAPQQPPAPALPANPVDAIKTILQAAGSAQETIRAGNSDLMQLQSRFLDLQMERKEKQPGNDFDGLTAQMTQIVDDIKRVISSQDQALAQIVAQQNLLSGVVVNAPDAPPTAAALHQKATTELADRSRKAQAICDGSAKMRDNAIKALADGSFTAKAGVAVYAAELFELPSVLRDLISKLESTTKQYRDAKSQLDPLLNTASGLLNTASAGKPLPASAGNDMNQMEATATRFSKNFGAWNATINNPWKSARAQLAGVKKEDNLEAMDLFWRGEKLYDAFSQAYGEADEAGKNVIHMVSKLRLYSNAAPASTAAADGEIRSLIDAMDKLRTVVNDPVGRLNDAKRELPGKKKALASVDTTAIASLEKALTDLNQDIEKVRANLSALQRSDQEAGLMSGLIKSRFSAKGVDKKLVANLKKGAEAVGKIVSPALVEGRKTEAAMVALRDEWAAKRAGLGSPASVEDTVRLQGVLKTLPPMPGPDVLLPANGVKKWKAQTEKGGDKNAAKLFADVTKAWETAEKKTDNGSLEELDRRAALFLEYFNSLDAQAQADATETKRADKCREAQSAVRKLRLKSDRDSLPEPPWTEAQATKAKQIEACTLLENGTPAKPPSAKGESDSFFIKNADAKPAFIFKPKQGENVKEGGKEGEGVVREVLSSKFNGQIKEMTGVDCGVCPTNVARLESDSFAQGEKSKAKSRVGALQQVSENEGNLMQQAAKDPTLVAKIKTEDVQKIAMLDFLTLQGDRNPDNILIKDVNGEKRLVPIDGGFAFPSTELFNTYSSGMAADPKGGKTGQVQSGQNGLMQLPQSDQKFTPEMLKAIDAVDPAALVKGMKQTNADVAKSAPELKGLVPDENIENVRRSALFLKQAAREFTVAELAEVYALDFKRVLAAPAKQLDKEIAAVIKQGKARVELNKQLKQDKATYDQLGGDAEIAKLGWDLQNDRVLRLNWKRKIEILKKKEKAPVSPKVADAPVKPTPDDATLEREFKALGGEKEYQKVCQRQDNSPKLPPNPKIIGKVGRLRLWKEYNEMGGDKGFDKVVKLWQDNQYTPFDRLPKLAQGAVAAFSTWSGDPYALGLGGKVQALKDFKKFS